MNPSLWQNKVNGKVYSIVFEATEWTEGRVGNPVIVYRLLNGTDISVMAAPQFQEDFVPVTIEVK